MNIKHTTLINKRGNKYTVRATRIATGYSKMLADKKSRSMNDDILRLAVKGTTDELNGLFWLCKRITIQHPTDAGYYKQAYILNDAGRSRLKHLRYMQKMKQQAAMSENMLIA